MGWCSGSDLFIDIINILKVDMPDPEPRKRLYAKLWRAFKDMDWDCEGDVLGLDPVYDELYYERYPREEE